MVVLKLVEVRDELGVEFPSAVLAQMGVDDGDGLIFAQGPGIPPDSYVLHTVKKVAGRVEPQG